MQLSVVGIGNMGRAVACGLLAAGHDVMVFNRSREKAEQLASAGARVADTAAEAIRFADYTLVVLYDETSTRSVLLSEDVRKVLGGKALISAAAMEPDEIIRLSGDVGEEGGRLSDVLIMTYPHEVQCRQSEFAIAAFPEDAKTWIEIFHHLGPSVYDVGPVGNAAKAQMALWLSYMFLTIAISYSVAAFDLQNLPIEVVQSALSKNPTIAIAGAEYIIPEMAARSYGTERWTVDNMVSSVDQAIRFAGKLGLQTEVMSVIRAMYAKASDLGFGNRDVSALYEAVNPRQAP